MDIYFGAPGHAVEAMIVGAVNGSLLSSEISCSLDEGDYLKAKSRRLHEQEPDTVVFQPFWGKPHQEAALMIQVADLTKLELSEQEAQEIGAKIFVAASTCNSEELVVDFSQNCPPEFVAQLAAGFQIRSFCFDKYKTTPPKRKRIQKVYFISSSPEATQKAFEPLKAVADAVDTVRSLSSEVPNVLTPECLAQEAKNLKKWGVKVDIFDEKDMAKIGMNALLGVAQGSSNPPYLAVLQWHGGAKNENPVALVGKGVTFDSGGISLKPSKDMHEMKEDMTGAAIVLTTLQMAATLNLPLNLVGIMGLVENMPSGSAQRPADVVQSLSGKTIEIQNTDAEGRLVLADALTYVEKEFAPRCIVDFATLTGAIQVALGQEFAGLFSNHDGLSQALIAAGERVKERLWRLPLDAAYDKDIDSDIADVKNVGSGRGAGSITAAQFLQRFIHESTPWAHIDIAAVTCDKKGRALTGPGFTGYGVRLMASFLQHLVQAPRLV